MDMVNIGLGTAAATGLMGYLVVFLGIVMLMIVVMIMGKIMTRKKASPVTVTEVTPQSDEPEKEKAPGSAGELKLYDTDPRDAAMIMAIVADSLGKPLNELRFKSIKEVSEDEV